MVIFLYYSFVFVICKRGNMFFYRGKCFLCRFFQFEVTEGGFAGRMVIACLFIGCVWEWDLR